MRLLCVDFGNVCRGPMVEAVLRARLGRAGLVEAVESAGISVVSPGEPPDPRARAVAAARGYRIEGFRARALASADFARYDRVFAVDRYVLDGLLAQAPAARAGGLRLLHPEGVEIADPYEGATEDFVRALDLIEDAADGLAAALARARI